MMQHPTGTTEAGHKTGFCHLRAKQRDVDSATLDNQSAKVETRTRGAASIAAPQTVDPAILIALAVALGKQGGLSAVPDVFLEPLIIAASHGCGASRMVIEWLERRSLSSVGGGHE